MGIVALLLMVAVFADEALPPVTIHEATDFAQLGSDARRQGVPILLMFSADHCPYCEVVKEDYLKPMLRSGDYAGRVLIRRIELDTFEKVRDFNGEEIYRDDLSQRYGVWVTPTLVYLDHRGVELAEKMVGLTTPDYYGGYIDLAIDQARARVESAKWVTCEEPRPQLCTMEYLPVCGESREGERGYANGCSACSDPLVSRYHPGECRDGPSK